MKGTLCSLRPVDQEKRTQNLSLKSGAVRREGCWHWDGLGMTDYLWGPNWSEQASGPQGFGLPWLSPGAVTLYGVLEYPLTGVPTGLSTSLPLSGT